MGIQDFLHRLQDSGNQLNTAQQAAVCHTSGPMQVIAGPGSGKTRVITARIAALLAAGVNPRRLLVLTFTRAAAAEMRRRVVLLPGVTREQAAGLSIGTFHSIFLKALNHFQGNIAIASDRERRLWLERALLENDEEINDELLREMESRIGYNKNSMVPLNTVPRHELLHNVWSRYEQQKEAAQKLDYDDLLLQMHALLLNEPSVCERLRRHWHFIMVDEFQDTCLVQYEILRLLAQPRNNLFVVGDVDQAIYSWRAARPELLLNFATDFPGCQTHYLAENYRSTAPLIQAANRLIRHNSFRHPLLVRPVRSGGIEPRVLTPANELAEAKAVVTMLQRRKEAGDPLEELAVFFRSNSQVLPLIDLLVEQDMPFVLRDQSSSLFTHWVSEEIHAFLRLAAGEQDAESCWRVARRNLGLPREAAARVEAAWRGSRLPFWQAIEQLPAALIDSSKLLQLKRHLQQARSMGPARALQYYLNDMGYASYLQWYAERRGNQVDTYVTVARELQGIMYRHDSIESYLQHVQRLEEILRGAVSSEGRQGAVNLLTLHGAKGLEFGSVWILGVVNGLLPHELSQTAEETEEERRLFYVGCTRAKDRLYIMCPEKFRQRKVTISPFVAELLGEAKPASEAKAHASRDSGPTEGRRSDVAAALDSSHLGREADGATGLALPQPGSSIEHQDMGQGRIIDCHREGAAGKEFHVVTVQFAERTVKLHWELSIKLGIVR